MRAILALALIWLGATFAPIPAAHATDLNCKVYTSVPGAFLINQHPVIPCATRGALFTLLMDAAGNARGANVNASNQLTVSVDNTVAVNCTIGCAGGSFNNNADNVATSATNGQSAAWLYLWDGAAWDRAPGNSVTGLTVNGTVTVTDGAGALNTIVDSGTLTTVTTITNPVTVTDGAGALNVIVDSGSLTIGNAGGASAVNIQDGGNSITVDGTVSITANSSVNVNQLAGTATSVNSGLKDAGTLRVVIATDQPALTNKLLVTPDSVALPANQSVNVSQINGVTPLMGTGSTGTGSPRVTVATDNVAVPLWGHGATASAVPANGVYMGISDAGTLRGVLSAANSLNSTGAGLPAAQLVGQCDDTSPTGLTENSFGNARIDCASHAQLVTAVPSATAGGTTLFTLTAAASTNATNIKASAGQLYSISGFTISATAAWISLYNTSGTPTCGTSIIQQFLIPGSTSGAGFVYDFATPKGFASGIGICITTGIAGTGSVAASNYVVNIDYK